jgi:hypothetical protein
MSSLSMNTPRGVHDLSAVLEDENEPSSSHSNIHHTPNPFSDVSRLLHASQMSHTAVDDAEQFLGLGERNRYDVSHLFSPKEGVAATPADAPRAGSSSSRSPGKHKKARARSMSPSKRKGYTFSRSSRGLMPSGDENEARTGKPNASTTRSQSRSRSMSPGKRSRHRNGPQFLSHSMRTTLASRSGGRLRYSPLSSSLTTPLRGVDPRSLSSSFARASAHALHASSSSPDTYARHNRNRQQLGYRAKTIEEVDELLKRTAFSNELAYYQFLTMGTSCMHVCVCVCVCVCVFCVCATFAYFVFTCTCAMYVCIYRSYVSALAVPHGDDRTHASARAGVAGVSGLCRAALRREDAQTPLSGLEKVPGVSTEERQDARAADQRD